MENQSHHSSPGRHPNNNPNQGSSSMMEREGGGSSSSSSSPSFNSSSTSNNSSRTSRPSSSSSSSPPLTPRGPQGREGIRNNVIPFHRRIRNVPDVMPPRQNHPHPIGYGYPAPMPPMRMDGGPFGPPTSPRMMIMMHPGGNGRYHHHPYPEFNPGMRMGGMRFRRDGTGPWIPRQRYHSGNRGRHFGSSSWGNGGRGDMIPYPYPPYRPFPFHQYCPPPPYIPYEYKQRGGVPLQQIPAGEVPFPFTFENNNNNNNTDCTTIHHGLPEEEEYVPQPVTVIRRIRLASIETICSTSSASTLNSIRELEEENEEEDASDVDGIRNYLDSDTETESETEDKEKEHNVEDDDNEEEETPDNDPSKRNEQDHMDDRPKTITAHLAVVMKYVLLGKQRSEERAAYGIWFENESELNMAGEVPFERMQNLKSVLIYAAHECVSLLKEKGIYQASIKMESDFVVRNVKTWVEKATADEELKIVEPSNWNEYKYGEEISMLCTSSQGMRINWIYLPLKTEGIDKAKELAYSALPKFVPDGDVTANNSGPQS